MLDFVISNTAPIFYLHRLGQLDVLRKIYGKVVIPEAVADELLAGKKLGEDVPDILEYDWIEIKSVLIPEIVSPW